MADDVTSIVLLEGGGNQPKVSLAGSVRTDESVAIKRIGVVWAGSTFDFDFVSELPVPGSLLIGDGNSPRKFKPLNQIDDEATRHASDELWTRLANLKISGNAFFGIRSVYGTALAGIELDARFDGAVFSITFRAFAAINVGGQSIAVALSVVIRATPPKFSISLFDGLLRLPEVELRNFGWNIDFPQISNLGEFVKLPMCMPIQATANPAMSLTLALSAAGELSFTTSAVNVNLAMHQTSIGSISNFQVASNAAGASVSGVLTLTQIPSPALGTFDVRGLRIVVSRVQVMMAVLNLAGAAGAKATIRIGWLEISPLDSPSDRLVVAATVELTRDGIEVTNVELIEPTRFVLAGRIAKGIGQLDFAVPATGSPHLPNLGAVFALLAKILSVMANAAGAVANAAGAALVALARAIEQLIAALVRLLREGMAGMSIRFMLAPHSYEPVVILIHPLRAGLPAPPAIDISTPLLHFNSPGNVTPALLLDRRAGRTLLGVVALAELGATTSFAELSTDLWLARPGPGANGEIERLNSSDKADPAATAPPLLSISMATKAGAPNQLHGLLVAGISDGKALALRYFGPIERGTQIGQNAVLGFSQGVFYKDPTDELTIVVKTAPNIAQRVLPFLPQGPTDSAPDDFFAKLRERVRITNVSSSVSSGKVGISFDVQVDV